MDDTATDTRPCACGCGGTPRRHASRYLPGHHKQRLDPLAGRFVVDEATGSWIWHGYKLWNGYGQTTYRRRRWLAHRLSFFLRQGRLPEGDAQIHHACANRACINPDHLEEATPIANRRAAPTKLDLDRARQIRGLAGGASQAEIAERFGVHHSAVSLILRDVIWAGAPEG